MKNLTIVETLARYWKCNNIHHQYTWRQRDLCSHRISYQTNSIQESCLHMLTWPNKFHISYNMLLIQYFYLLNTKLTLFKTSGNELWYSFKTETVPSSRLSNMGGFSRAITIAVRAFLKWSENFGSLLVSPLQGWVSSTLSNCLSTILLLEQIVMAGNGIWATS